MHAVRLDPAKLMPFDVKPVIELANGSVRMMLGRTQIVSAAARWDCALGRITGDASAFGVVLSNAAGTLFWAVSKALTGDVWEQCRQIKAIVLELQLPRVVVETNGPGAFAPAVLKKVLHGTGCGVAEEFSTLNKNKRILDAFEAPLSGGFLWAHVDVIDTVWDEMKDWKPTVKEQPDNHLDAGAGAIRDNPMRIGKVIGDRLQSDGRRPRRLAAERRLLRRDPRALMPVGAYAGANVSNGNGVTTLFPYNFKILDQTHIEVKVDGVLKVLGADYTVTGVGLSNGGNVVFGVAPANGAVVQRARKVPYTRAQDYQNNGDFKENTVDSTSTCSRCRCSSSRRTCARVQGAALGHRRPGVFKFGRRLGGARTSTPARASLSRTPWSAAASPRITSRTSLRRALRTMAAATRR
jgi:hypothetical protein